MSEEKDAVGLNPNQILMDLPKCGTKAIVTINHVGDDGQIQVEYQWLPVEGVSAEAIEAEIGEIINKSLASAAAREGEEEQPCSTD